MFHSEDSLENLFTNWDILEQISNSAMVGVCDFLITLRFKKYVSNIVLIHTYPILCSFFFQRQCQMQM